MDQLDGLPLALANGIGVVGVVMIVGWLVWTGRLVPKSTHDQLIAFLEQRNAGQVALLEQRNEAQVTLLNQQLEDERHEKGEWRTECRIKDQTIGELSEQHQSMLNAFGPTLTDFLQGLRRAGIGTTRAVERDEG